MSNTTGTGSKKSGGFLSGKGFYIVLFLCVAVIGVSAWTLMKGIGTVRGSDIDDPSLSNTKPNQAVETKRPASGPEEDPNFNETEWAIPDGVQEVIAQAEPPETGSETISVPEVPVQAPASEEAPRAFVWPVVGEVEMPYSVAALIYDRTMADWRTHSGVDVLAPLGEKVLAAASGTVCEVSDDALYGTTVKIDHGAGLVSIYSNLASVPTVGVGDSVLVGATIGSVGDTALCETGEPTHLHFAMTLNGETVDPSEYLPEL